MTEFRYPLTAGSKSAEQGRDIKVASFMWVAVDALPTTGDEGQVYVLLSDGLAYQWWGGAWRQFSGAGSAPIGLTAADIAYTNSSHPSFATVKDALDHIFYVPLSLSSFSNNVGSREIGQVVTDVTFNWSYNKSVTQQSITGYPNIAIALRTLVTTGLSLTTNTTWSLSATDGTGSVSGNTSIAFYNRRHWGVSAMTTPDGTLINSLAGSELASNRNQTKTFVPGGQYLYFAWPVSFGTTPTFTINSFPVAGWLTTTMSHTNAYGYSTQYIVFRSQYPQLAPSITVVVT